MLSFKKLDVNDYGPDEWIKFTADFGVLSQIPQHQITRNSTAEEIKAIHPDLPLFVFTAINREYAFDFSKDDIKADEFINKPVKLDRLVEKIRQYI